MRCPVCGTEVPEVSTFCLHCGVAADECAFVDAEGNGLSLGRGTYTLEVATPPLMSDGGAYAVSDTIWNITVGDDLAASIPGMSRLSPSSSPRFPTWPRLPMVAICSSASEVK